MWGFHVCENVLRLFPLLECVVQKKGKNLKFVVLEGCLWQCENKTKAEFDKIIIFY